MAPKLEARLRRRSGLSGLVLRCFASSAAAGGAAVAATPLPAADAAQETTGAAQAFMPRPQAFPAMVPSPDAFQKAMKAGGRRLLAAEDGKPERSRMEFEEDGHRFVYEFAGDAGDTRFLDLDQDAAVDGLACEVGAAAASSFAGAARGAKDALSTKAETRKANHSPRQLDDISRVWLRWRDGSLPAEDSGEKSGHAPTASTVQAAQALARQLREGDIITGAAAWGCGKQRSGFLLRITAVEKRATDADPVSVFRTRPSSPFEVFRDLYVDFSWIRTPRNTSPRRLDTFDWDHQETLAELHYNYDPVADAAARAIPLGPVSCRSCYATMSAELNLQLVTDGYMPALARMRVSGGFRAVVDVSVASVVEAVPSGWVEVANWTGTDLLQVVGMSIPLFNFVNSLTLNLKAIPQYTLHINADITSDDLLQDESFGITLDTTHQDTFFQVDWTPANGFVPSAGFELTKEVVVPEVYRGGGRMLRLSMRPCVTMDLTAGGSDEPLSTLELCPDFTALAIQASDRIDAARLEASQRMVAQSAGASVEADSQLCIETMSFKTNSNSDVFDLDGYAEPFAQVCFFGQCVETSRNRRFGRMTNEGACDCNGPLYCQSTGSSSDWCYVDGSCSSKQSGAFGLWSDCSRNRVDWVDGPQCIPIQASTLDTNDIAFHVLEDDPWFNDEYTLVWYHSLNSTCRTADGCHFAWDLDLSPNYALTGTVARLHATISVQSLRRVQEEGQDVATICGSSPGTALQLQVGAKALFGGIKYPSFFDRGAYQVVADPVDGPTLNPDSPISECFEASESTSADSASALEAGRWRLCILAVAYAALEVAWLGS